MERLDSADAAAGLLPGLVRSPEEIWASPTPATHSILTVWKAGEAVHQKGELPETP